ncbi:MAG: Thiol-disulfide isomerase [Parcubacteria group bacterium]|nr:Thiol-disulfide isomerase [Parcubacteria group bacterium]
MSYSRTITLVVVLVMIAGAIGYIESHVARRGASNIPAVSVVPRISSTEKAKTLTLASELAGPTGFINTPDNAPITLGSYVGNKVVLLDFWTYSCINCQRTLPYLEAWYEKYKDYGLVIVGVHTPEFDFEKVYDNVAMAVKKYGLTYPVVLDSNYGTWNAYNNQYWPAEYLIDIDGYIAAHDVGEGDYAGREAEIQKALQERSDVLGLGLTIPGGTVDPTNAVKVIDAGSPETYFGSARNEFLSNGTAGKAGVQSFTLPATSDTNKLYLGGSWDIEPEYATANDGDTIMYTYNSKVIYFVASSPQGSTLTLIQDGKTVGTVDVKTAQLYKLVENPTSGVHTLEIKVKGSGLEAFTFTFG